MHIMSDQNNRQKQTQVLFITCVCCAHLQYKMLLVVLSLSGGKARQGQDSRKKPHCWYVALEYTTRYNPKNEDLLSNPEDPKPFALSWTQAKTKGTEAAILHSVQKLATCQL